MNAVTGTDRSGFEDVVGRFGSGVLNDNFLRLLSCCASFGLSIVSSYFRRRDIHRWTWYSNDGRTKKELDHVITRKRDRGLFKSYSVYRGAEAPASTDHMLVIASLLVQLPFVKPRCKPTLCIDVERLRSDPALAHRYAVEVHNCFSSLGSLDADDVETSWTKLSCAIKEAATSVVGPKRNIKKPWLTDDTYDVLLLKATARCRGDVPERRRLQVFNAKAKLDKEAYFNNLADELQQGMGQNNL